MKKFSTQYTNGQIAETSLPYEARSFFNYDPLQLWFLKGKQVSAIEFFEEVDAAVDAAFEKKNKTHKQVRVLYGSSVASYETKWIRR